MKTNIGASYSGKALVATLAVVLLATGCSNSTKSDSANSNTAQAIPLPIPVPVPGGTLTPIGGTGTYSTGSTVDFTPKDLSTMNDYVAVAPLNNPSGYKVNVNLRLVEAGRYGGEIKIGYNDSGRWYEGTFKAGVGKNVSLSGLKDSGVLEANYNYWFTYDNQPVFSGFFEDQYGALVIVISPDYSSGTNLGDGQGTATKYAGHIYFKNFTTSFATHSPYRSCWFTYLGPYDCRSNIVQTKCGLYPEAGYKFLGSFKGLDLSKAFNVN